ncbi:MAG: MogA/MoaB family molybdenum cofactor biosynthesis protein [Chthonomonadales bacterium]
MISYRVGVLTVSDRCSLGEAQDRSGPALVALVDQFGFVVVETAAVPDEPDDIQTTLKQWFGVCDLILTTGGTGLSPRDITPEATTPLLDRPTPGISEFIRASAFARNPRAALSRGVSGLIGSCLIVNLPGSEKAATEGWESLKLLLPHALDIATNQNSDH